MREFYLKKMEKRFLYTENKKKNALIVFVLYFIVVGKVFFTFCLTSEKWHVEVLRFVWGFFFYLFFYIELFDIHPNNLKCCPAEKSPSAALKTKVFKEEFVCMLWFCEAVLFVVQRMKLWQLRNMGNILILTPTECVDVVS